jgi:hypothetical protein
MTGFMMASRFMFAGVLMWLTATTGLARSPVDAAIAWGLIGTWALDCSARPSGPNGYLTYERASSDQLVHKRDYGAIKDEHPIIEAKRLDDGALELVFDFSALSPPQQRRVIIERVSIDSIRARENQVVGTTNYSIRDGTFVHNGKPVPLQMRCLPTL